MLQPTTAKELIIPDKIVATFWGEIDISERD